MLNDLFVAVHARGSGAGRALLHAARAHGEANGAVRLTLSTQVQNTTAQSLYEAAGWQRLVYVEDEGEKVRIYAKLEGQRMVGMTVMVVGDDEGDETAGETSDGPGDAVFINIAGDIDPAKLGRIASEVGVDGIGGLGENDR